MIKTILVLLLYILPTFAAERQQTCTASLYYSPHCPHSQKVLSYLKESGTTVTLRNVLRDPEAKKELQEYGGYMIVPCLVVEGKAIYDAPDIIDWLSFHQTKTTSSP